MGRFTDADNQEQGCASQIVVNELDWCCAVCTIWYYAALGNDCKVLMGLRKLTGEDRAAFG